MAATFAPFPVLSLWVCPHLIKVSLPPLYPWHFSCEKNVRLSTPAQLQCLRPGVWKPGNKASSEQQFKSHVLKINGMTKLLQVVKRGPLQHGERPEWRPGCETNAVIVWKAHEFEVNFHAVRIIGDCPALLISSSALSFSIHGTQQHESSCCSYLPTNTLRHSKLTTETLTRTHSN